MRATKITNTNYVELELVVNEPDGVGITLPRLVLSVSVFSLDLHLVCYEKPFHWCETQNEKVWHHPLYFILLIERDLS
jgi:hypothetical protein